MKGLSRGTELLHFAKDPADGEWYAAQLAVNGTLATMFSIPTPTVYSLLDKGEEHLAAYLESQAMTMIDRYGDARSPRPDPALLDEKVA